MICTRCRKSPATHYYQSELMDIPRFKICTPCMVEAKRLRGLRVWLIGEEESNAEANPTQEN